MHYYKTSGLVVAWGCNSSDLVSRSFYAYCSPTCFLLHVILLSTTLNDLMVKKTINKIIFLVLYKHHFCYFSLQ
jgi:hypothetical protein